MQDERIIPELKRGLCDIGFVLVAGHGIPEALVSDLRHQTATYFDRPIVRKAWRTASPPRIIVATFHSAFFSPNASLHDTGTTPDQYEGYKLHFEVTADNAIRTACDLLRT